MYRIFTYIYIYIYVYIYIHIRKLYIPWGSMYGIFTYIWLIFMGNVGKYTIHGSSGIQSNPTKWRASTRSLFPHEKPRFSHHQIQIRRRPSLWAVHCKVPTSVQVLTTCGDPKKKKPKTRCVWNPKLGGGNSNIFSPNSVVTLGVLTVVVKGRGG